MPKNVWFLLSRHDVRRNHKKFWSRRFERADACYSHFGLLNPKTFVSYFLDMMYFVFMKNFLLADSGVQMAVRLISASWAQKKPFYFYLLDTMYVEFMKIFFSLTAARRYLLDSFRPPEPKNVWFLLSTHDVRRVHEKFPYRRYRRADACSTHFGLLRPKTFYSYFLDMMYFEFMKNFLLAVSS